ncbi:MAG: hypothetical protein HYZ42_02880 [Bacteroidetes bacterium]|nr:hypothetical protein [Bacteroidota bacterium]
MSTPLDSTFTRFSNYSHRADGVVDIKSISYPPFENLDTMVLSRPLVIVLIEKRILQPVSGLGSSDDIAPRLTRLKADLLAEGKHCRFIEVEFNQTTADRDGLKILALRAFLREVRTIYGSFKGCILIGSFPEATIVRRLVWAPRFNNMSINGRVNSSGANFLAIGDKGYSRTDLPLMDLNGNWDNLYQKNYTGKSILAIPDSTTMRRNWYNVQMVTAGQFSSTFYQVNDKLWKDVFYIDDTKYTLPAGASLPAANNYPTGPLLTLNLSPECANPEISSVDRSLVNPIAIPDIHISRINAKPVAVNPSSVQQRVWYIQYQYDPLIERKLLNEYLDMNHRFRTNGMTQVKKGMALMTSSDFNASGYKSEIETKLPPSIFTHQGYLNNGGSVINYVDFIKQPHIVKAFIAHSDEWGSTIPGRYDVAQLATLAGSPITNTKDATTGRLSANHASQGDRADYCLHRTLWQNHKLDQDTAGVYVHGGCFVNSMNSALENPVDSVTMFDTTTMAESLLFFLNNLAVVCRNTDYNDFPYEFFAGLTVRGSTLGDAYKNIYTADANNAGLNLISTEKKRSYNWSMLGDWTIKLNLS